MRDPEYVNVCITNVFLLHKNSRTRCVRLPIVEALNGDDDKRWVGCLTILHQHCINRLFPQDLFKSNRFIIASISWRLQLATRAILRKIEIWSKQPLHLCWQQARKIALQFSLAWCVPQQSITCARLIELFRANRFINCAHFASPLHQTSHHGCECRRVVIENFVGP